MSRNGPTVLQSLNHGLRFLLELAALACYLAWGWQSVEPPVLRGLAALSLPLAVATAWGLFNVPGDPGRSGRAPVPVPGWLRLGLELGVFAGAALCLHGLGVPDKLRFFLFLVFLHYAVSFPRLRWLLRQR